MTELRARMIEDMELHGYAPRTREVYVNAVRLLAEHYGRSPDRLTEDNLRRYFFYLRDERGLADSTIRVRFHAIKFFFRKTLHRPWRVLDIIRVKRRKRLPIVLSRQEVHALLKHMRQPVARMVSLLLYGCGLRVSEATHLRAEHIDRPRRVLTVRNGKRGKDRCLPLPQRLLDALTDYWRQHRPKCWLFPDRRGLKPIPRATVRQAIYRAAKDAGLQKRPSCHTLRHCFATHLLEQGIDLRVLQGLMGHASLRSTAVYLHLTQATRQTARDAVEALAAHL